MSEKNFTAYQPMMGSGIAFVAADAPDNKFQAYATAIDGTRELGIFDTFEDACDCAKSASDEWKPRTPPPDYVTRVLANMDAINAKYAPLNAVRAKNAPFYQHVFESMRACELPPRGIFIAPNIMRWLEKEQESAREAMPEFAVDTIGVRSIWGLAALELKDDFRDCYQLVFEDSSFMTFGYQVK